MQLSAQRNIVALRRVARTAFWIALLLLLAFTLLPIKAKVPLLNDKVEHFLSFLALTLLGAFAWGERRLPHVVIALAIVGGTIELCQAIPAIGRDAEFLDWVADLGGVGVAVLLVKALTPSRW